MRLFIAEKPSAAKAIAEELGNARRMSGYFDCGGTLVSYCVGHLFEQKEPDAYLPDDIPRTRKGKKIWRTEDLPIVPEKWLYTPKKETKDQLKILGQLIKRASEIVNAGDLDREGQAIIDHVLEHFKCKVKVKRFLVSAQDSVSIQRALRTLQDNRDYAGWRNAALARQRADWLVGMNLSRAFTLAAQAQIKTSAPAKSRSPSTTENSLLVVGRVQSPTLALVVARDRIIENFVAKDFYAVSVTLQHSKGNFTAHWQVPADHPKLDDEGRLLDKTAAETAVSDLDGAPGVIEKYSKQAKTIPQPLGLSLSDITLLASNQHGLTAEDTLRTLQSLYETHKLCSYPRTDCSYLPKAQKADAQAILDAVAQTYPAAKPFIDKADTSITSRIWDDKKVTAHHAIVPTMQIGNVAKLSDRERKLYNTIVKYYVAQFYPRHGYNATTIDASAIGLVSTKTTYALRATGRVVTTIGWKALFANDSKRDQTKPQESTEQELPLVRKGDDALCNNPELIEKKTTPPKHFTDGTLIKALEQIYKHVDNPEYKKLLKEEDGIGTPATRSTIIGELKRRQYLNTKGKYLISSELGRRLVDTLPESVTSPVMTAKYERELLNIQNNRGSLDTFVEQQVDFITQQIARAPSLIIKPPAASARKGKPVQAKREKPAAKPTAKPGGKTFACPSCSQSLVRRKSKFKGKSYWWGCSGYPDCQQKFDDNRGKPLLENKPAATATTTDHQCPKCQSPLVRRKSTKSGFWYGCSAFPKCRERFDDQKGRPKF